MFDDINKMEAEIKEFRQNILASSQLVDGMNSLVKESQNQQALMRQVSSDYQNSIQSITENAIKSIESLENENTKEMKGMVEACLAEAANQISVTNKQYIDELAKMDASIKIAQSDITDCQNAIRSVIDSTIVEIKQMETESSKEMKSMVESCLSEAVQQISATSNAYIEELANADASIKAAQADLADKYTQFTAQMENTKVEEVIKTCSDLKKSLELKITLAVVGVIVVIVLEIVQLIV